MKNKRDIYGVSFLKLVDSAWTPRLDMKRFDNFRLRDSKYHISVKTSVNGGGVDKLYEPVTIKKFESKEEFIAFAVQEAVKVWDQYEATKKFGKETAGIIEDIDNNISAEPYESTVAEGDFYSWQHEDVRKYAEIEANPDSMTEEELVAKIKEIREKNINDSWKPYILLKEVYGVDLINPPDVATEEKAAEVRSKRPSAESNNGIVRRSGDRVRKTGYTA